MATDGVHGNDGIDLGIVTSSSLKMNVKHVFSAVANGTNTSTTVEAASGSNKTLAMKAVASIYVDEDDDDATTIGIDETAVCDNDYDAGDLTDKPKGCFRLRGPGAGTTKASKGADYLSGWSIELSPVGGDVTWGEVDWEDNPFEDLTCGDADPIMVADHVDICEMFDAEVDLATSDGWSPTVVFNSERADYDSTDTDQAAAADQVVMWKATTGKKGSGTEMFKTVWFDDNLNSKIEDDGSASRPMQPGASPGDAAVAADSMHDLYNDNSRLGNIDAIWESLTDSDGDLKAEAGDLGKVDLVSSKDDRKTADDERTILVESCPSGTSWAPRDGYSADGTGTTRTATALDGTGCKTSAQRTGRLAGVFDGASDSNFNANAS